MLIGNAKLAPVAVQQVQAYLARRNGLKDNGPDVDPGWTNTARYTVESFKADELRVILAERIKAAQEKVTVKKSRLEQAREKVKALRDKLKGLPR